MNNTPDPTDDGFYAILKTSGQFADSRVDVIIDPCIRGLRIANGWIPVLNDKLTADEREKGIRHYTLPSPVGRR